MMHLDAGEKMIAIAVMKGRHSSSALHAAVLSRTAAGAGQGLCLADIVESLYSGRCRMATHPARSELEALGCVAASGTGRTGCTLVLFANNP